MKTAREKVDEWKSGKQKQVISNSATVIAQDKKALDSIENATQELRRNVESREMRGLILAEILDLDPAVLQAEMEASAEGVEGAGTSKDGIDPVEPRC